MSFDLSEEESILDLNIRKELAQIIERGRNNAITEDDSKYLERISVTDEEFVLITDDFGLRHGEIIRHEKANRLFMFMPTFLTNRAAASFP